eukprot:4404697-Prymnesium_polylepis.1
MSGDPPNRPPPAPQRGETGILSWLVVLRYGAPRLFEAFHGGAPVAVGFFGIFFSSQAFTTLFIPSQGLLIPPPRGVPQDMARTLCRSG